MQPDNTNENMQLLWGWLKRNGRPLAYYTDKAAMFETSPKASIGDEKPALQPTQITRALAELGIERISLTVRKPRAASSDSLPPRRTAWLNYCVWLARARGKLPTHVWRPISCPIGSSDSRCFLPTARMRIGR